MANPYADLGVEDDEEYKALGMEEDATPPPVDTSSIAPTPFGPVENPVHAPGAGEAFVQGVGNSIAGTGDLMGAAIQTGLTEFASLPDFLQGRMTLKELQSIRNRVFRDARADNLSRSRRGMEEHPVASIGGRIVPSLAMAPVTGVGNTLAAALASGAVQGGVEGAAQSEADTAGELASDTGMGMGFGALGGGAGYGLGKYVVAPAGAFAGQKLGEALSRGSGSLREGLRRFAQERALKASGYIQKDLPDDPAAMGRLLQRGQRVLDEPGLLRVGSSAATIGERAEPLRRDAGEGIGWFLQQADDSATDAFHGAPPNPEAYAAAAERLRDTGQWTSGGGHFNPQQLADQARAKGGVVAEAMLDPNNAQQGRVMDEWLATTLDAERQLTAQGDPFSFARANQYKGGLQSSVYNNKGLVKPNKVVADDFQRLVTDAIDDQAEPFIGAAGVDAFRLLRQRYGDFADVTRRAAQQTNREVGNNFMGIKDLQSGQMAQQTKGLGDLPYVGPAFAIASKISRGRMDSTAARGADALAKSPALQRLTEASPGSVGAYGSAIGGAAGAAAGDWLSTLASTQPEVLGRWGQYLANAESQSPEALSEAHFQAAQQDPDYQRRLRALGEKQ